MQKKEDRTKEEGVIEKLQKAAKLGFEVCNGFGAGHVEVIPRNKKEEPVALFLCTTEKELAKRIERVLKEYDEEDK